MRIVIDALGNKHGGGVTVLLDLLYAASQLGDIKETIILASPAAVRGFDIPPYANLRVVDVAAAETTSGRLWWAAMGLTRFLRTLDCDIVLGLNGFGGLDRTVASVVFIQQSIPYSAESMRRFPWAMRMRMNVIRWLTRRSAVRADHVLVQSESMRTMIADAFHISLERISAFMPTAPVLSRATAPSPKLQVLRSDTPPGAMLYVGNDSSHKNLEVVAQGLLQIAPAQRPKWYVTLPASSLVCREGAAVSLGSLDRSELREAYQHATFLVMPSLTETVGLPMLEAMRVGTPVLAADRPYAHAVCEGAAVLFDPLSPSDFAQKASRLCADVSWRNELADKGRALIKRRDELNPYRAMIEKVVLVARQVREQRGKGDRVSS